MAEPIEVLTRVVPYDPADGVLRRCSRCLRFLLDDGSSVARPNWWLCLPCHAALLPKTPRAVSWRTTHGADATTSAAPASEPARP